jgi:hypothetical protein
VIALTPVYQRTFRGSVGTVQFVPDATGRITAMVVSQDRVWKLRFERAQP